MTQKPAIGRIVHLTSPRTGEPVAAIMTKVHADGQGARLHQFTADHEVPDPEGGFFPYSETAAPGHWSWPPRV